MPRHIDEEPYTVLRFLSISTIVRPPYRIGLPNIDVKLKRAIRGSDFAILHAHTPFTTGKLALRIGREKGIPVVATFHTKYREDLIRGVKIKRIAEDELKRIVDFYYSADAVWVPQESVAKTLREYGYKGTYDVVENGIDMEVPPSVAPYREHGAAELGLPEGIPVGLYVGQYIFEKNLEFLLRSLPSVMEAMPDFRMVFVGGGYAKAALVSLAQDLGIGDKVIFHDVVFDRELLKAIYARGDLFLFPSLYDNAPLVVREAAAFQTPSVLISGSTAADVIRDGENGFLAEGTPEAFSAKIIGVMKDEKLLEKASVGAQTTLCRTWEDVVREVGERYLAILSRWAR
jgi:glycosyltransferase involved in cell wall biosynthesis